MVKSLTGRNALVTGSTAGVGLAVARVLAEAGANIILNGPPEKAGANGRAEERRADLEQRFGVTVVYASANLSQRRDIERMMRTARSELGDVDILVNCAHAHHDAPVEAVPDDAWEATLAINCSAAFYTTKAALPGMRERDWGRIINIASAQGLAAVANQAAEVAAKHGLIGLTKAVGLETAEARNVTCNAICPGYVKTADMEREITEQAKEHGLTEEQVIRDVILANQPSRRFVGTDEIGAMVLYLCSDAARSVNGSALSLDGGWTAR
ncbi:3-hydroxybutyrate dehydrogenase [Rhodothalassium salexigens DSM 2132]|uniref:3-hydroxybutyrate dehydrogenase n=1 Tax=Rhodothalassium salexigens DSM 2132 TaxID=1188247 RepID=A0A4R2PHG4_RHOSA|nr:3-hydroxybutyrate dehydrogenase [Rhodothalassium salexigens]MBB4211724.1 3-hydroxybutyrate dehydrogenase [Rhodothalassium salexigens DSM 2132]MBK1639185.1 3-hydroxybutyrate dehydrogenase [Rhodothalassium salexigens DSM 2132]TCP33978.1 3-hydroxybutyrate dehydrogenase [Rhodothalassium salexigens DSM 2132]